MLRMLFGERPREPEGKLLETMQAMERFGVMLHKQIAQGRDADHKLRKAEIWTIGLLASLDELEQSQYAASRFAAKVRSDILEAMSQEEMLDYHRYVYFDKNAFIRIFALLDKVGTLVNDFLALETERVKPRFSYFTVLRTMRQRGKHPELANELGAVKDKYAEPMARLRNRRNTEIHYMNSEMQDDLKRSHQAYGQKHPLENLQEQKDDLAKGIEMVLETLRIVFEYACSQMRKRR